MNLRRTRLAIGIAVMLHGLATHAQQPAPTVPLPAPSAAVQASFGNEPVAPDATLTLTFAQPFPYGPGRFAVMVGGEDVTAQFELIAPTVLRGVFAGAPLPPGDTVLAVHGLGEGNDWAEVATLPLKVAPLAGGTKRTLIKPTLALQASAQPWEAHSAGATPPARPRYAKAALQLGLNTDHGDDTWGLKSSVRLAAVTDRTDAVQYASLLGSARRVDLASYLVEGFYATPVGNTSVSLGQVSAGNHPLLASGISNRGLVARQALGSRAELTVAAQNAHPLVGTDNLSGLEDRGNRVGLASVGYELLERAGGLRVEASYFAAQAGPAPSLSSSSTSTLRERSAGWGLRLMGATEDNAWRADLSYALNDYTNQGATGGTPGASPKVQASAYSFSLEHDLVQGLAVWPDMPLTLTASLGRDRSAPHYRSLGAFGVVEDSLRNQLALSGSLGPITGSLAYTSHDDNVNDVATSFKTRSPSIEASLNLPLGTLLEPAATETWWPIVSYSYSRSHSFMDRAFAPGGTPLSQFTDDLATTHSLGFNWSVRPVTLSYTLTRVFQDNEQAGNEQADSTDLNHSLSGTWQISEAASFSASLGWNPYRDLGSGMVVYRQSANAGWLWRFGDRYSLGVTGDHAAHRDNPLSDTYRSYSAAVKLSKLFDLTLQGTKLPGEWVLSYRQDHNAAQVLASPQLSARYQTLNLGMSLAY